MTQAEKAGKVELEPVGQCWICWRALEPYTVEGRVYWGCPLCRRKIEAMQWRLRVVDPRYEAAWSVAKRRRGRRAWRRCTSAELEQARVIARTEGLGAAARALGIRDGTLRYRAKKEGWRVRSMLRRGR